MRFKMASFTPRKEMREPRLQQALRSFIVPAFTAKYEIIAVRALWHNAEAERNLWGKRRNLETILKQMHNVVAFFSCITAVDTRKRKNNESERKIEPGYSFWIAVDWPGFGLQKMCNKIEQSFLSSGLDISTCKPIIAKSKISFMLLSHFQTFLRQNKKK